MKQKVGAYTVGIVFQAFREIVRLTSDIALVGQEATEYVLNCTFEGRSIRKRDSLEMS